MKGVNALSVLVLAALLAGCNRIPLTPPDAGTPNFAFDVQWLGTAFSGDEGRGAWIFTSDTSLNQVRHSNLYIDEITGDQWELVIHQSLGADVLQWQSGSVAYRPLDGVVNSGQVAFAESSLYAAEWSVNEVEVVPDESGMIEWTADANGSVEIECDWEVDIDGEELDQRLSLELSGLNTCGGAVLPGPFTVEPGTYEEEETWAFHPPTSEPGVPWRWIVNGEYEEFTEGGNPLLVAFDDDWESDFEVKLVAEEEDGHPYGVFEVRYRLDWSGEEDEDWWSEVWSYEGIAILANLSESAPWMELRHLPAGGTWHASELLCSEADQADWNFEISEVLAPEQGSLYPTAERIAFTCALPLRLEGQWSEPVTTAQVSGVWPVVAWD